jgi:hypothetical protein
MFKPLINILQKSFGQNKGRSAFLNKEIKMKKIFSVILLSVTVLNLSSCLKSTDLIGPTAPNSAGAIIEFSNPAAITAGATLTVPTPRYDFTLEKTGDKVHVEVNYTGTGKVSPSDVTVGLMVDAATLSAHNTQTGKTYTLLPTALYTMPATVTIPAGQNKVGFDIIVKTDQYVTGTSYALPIKIASASSGTISGNFGTIILALARKA